MNKTLKKIKNFILKTITILSVIAWLLAVCNYEPGNELITIVVFCATSAWIVLFSYANDLFWKGEE